MRWLNRKRRMKQLLHVRKLRRLKRLFQASMAYASKKAYDGDLPLDESLGAMDQWHRLNVEVTWLLAELHSLEKSLGLRRSIFRNYRWDPTNSRICG